jgi:hypothetical protein
VRPVPGAGSASPDQAAQLGQLVARVIKPAELATGLEFVPTSWLRSPSSGSGAHATGGALDGAAARPGGSPTQDETLRFFRYVARELAHQVGEVGYELPRTGVTGHVHVTIPPIGGRGQVWMEEPGTGRKRIVDPWTLAFEGPAAPGAGDGSAENPITIPGIDVTVSRYTLAGWGILAGALWLAFRRG